MTEINANISKFQNIAPKIQPQHKKEESSKEERKGISKKGVLIGSSAAVAATVIGGLLYNKHVNTKQISKEIDTVKKFLKIANVYAIIALCLVLYTFISFPLNTYSAPGL